MVAAPLVPRLRPLPVDEGSGFFRESETVGGGSLHFQLVPHVKGANNYLVPVVVRVESIRLVGNRSLPVVVCGVLDLFEQFFLFTVLFRI